MTHIANSGVSRAGRAGQSRRGVIALAAALALLAPASPGAAAPTRELLLMPSGQTLQALVQQVTSLGGQIVAQLEIANTLLVKLPAHASAPSGSLVVANTPLTVASADTDDSAAVGLTTYRDTIGASATGGAGVTVALVDTGVADVADLAGSVEHVNVSGAAAGDGLGHGTHLGGLIAGHGALVGVAPQARILDVKVADDEGNTDLATVLRGMQAVADRGNVKVLNLSLSTGSPLPPQFDPLSIALDELWARGVTVVTAAGNDGPAKGSVSSPGNDPVVLTVGAIKDGATAQRDDDVVAEFSSRGSRFGGGKPDLAAPGVSLLSTRAPGSEAELENPQSLVGASYMKGSGTSMAAAIASGAVAAILSENPTLTPDAVKRLLKATAYTSKAVRRAKGAGAGGLDLAAALERARQTHAHAPEAGAQTVTADWTPADDEAQAWLEFADSWEAGDYEATALAWNNLSARVQVWAARMFSVAVVYGSLNEPSGVFEARAWAARQWAEQGWTARQWAARQWAARQWAGADWEARQWAARQWAARQWADSDWEARQWAARQWAARQWAARQWANDDWLSLAWTARQWASTDWAARGWAARQWAANDWLARQWAARQWAARQWAARQWAVDGWSDFLFEARQWAAGQWAARQWAVSWSDPDL